MLCNKCSTTLGQTADYILEDIIANQSVDEMQTVHCDRCQIKSAGKNFNGDSICTIFNEFTSMDDIMLFSDFLDIHDSYYQADYVSREEINQRFRDNYNQIKSKLI